MKLITNDELDKREGENTDMLAEAMSDQEEAPELNKYSISAYIESCWTNARSAKENGAEKHILRNMRQFEGQYENDKIAAIKKIGGSEVFMMITDAKCKNAFNWVSDILFQPGQRPWGIDPTPVPELSDEFKMAIVQEAFAPLAEEFMVQSVMQGTPVDPQSIQQFLDDRMPMIEKNIQEEILAKSKELAKQIEVKVDDKLTEGGWYRALKDCLHNVVIHTGIIKGPILKKRNVLKMRPDKETGKLTPIITEELFPHYESRHPLYIYPSADSTGVNDGYLIDRVQLTPIALQDLIGVPGYHDEEIYSVLEELKSGNLKEWIQADQEKATMNDEQSPLFYDSDKVDCLEFWGAVQGEKLIDWGISQNHDGKPIEHLLFYNVRAYKIGSHVIGILFNKHPLGHKPFYATSFENRDGSFWGKGLPEVISDVQSVCNACARAIVNNVGIASGPMVERNIDRIPASMREDRHIIPWKVWDVTETMMSGAPALTFYQPRVITEQLLGVYNNFSKIADEHSGIPAYAHGDPNVGGAGNALANYEKILTASGPVEIGSIKKGDSVVNLYGGTSTVIDVFPQGESDIFRLKFSNGEHVDCDMNHRWSVRTHNDRKFHILTTEEILTKGLFRKSGPKGVRNPNEWRPKWMLPILDYITFDPREVKIDPYTMGALLGDGDHRGRLTGMDKEIFDRIPYVKGKVDKIGHGKAWTCTIRGVRVNYRSYGLTCTSLNKFIPDDYLFNSREVRLELLRGLMDTDGCCSRAGEVFFATSSPRLAKDLVSLVRSLGAIVSSICEEDGGEFIIKGRKCTRQKMYRVVFNLPGEKIFHLKRKQKRVTAHQKTHTYITGIEYVGRNDATCITVNAKDGLFVCANYIPTHNTASGLNMLMGGAARGIRAIVSSIDEDLIKPSIEAQYYWCISQEENKGFICDYQIVTSGSSAALIKEQMAARRLEFMRETANPIDMQILGMDGRKYLLEETARSIQLELSRVFPIRQNPVVPSLEPQAPGQGNATLDQSGQPVSGQDNAQFTPQRTSGAPQPQPRASGGPVAPGAPYLVGEQGPEVIVPDQAGQVIPNQGGPAGPMMPTPQSPQMITDPWGDEITPGIKPKIWANLPLDDRAEDVMQVVTGARSMGPAKDEAFHKFFEAHGKDVVKTAEGLSESMHSGHLPHFFMYESDNTAKKR